MRIQMHMQTYDLQGTSHLCFEETRYAALTWAFCMEFSSDGTICFSDLAVFDAYLFFRKGYLLFGRRPSY